MPVLQQIALHYIALQVRLSSLFKLGAWAVINACAAVCLRKSCAAMFCVHMVCVQTARVTAI